MWQNFYWFFFSWDHIKGYTTMRSIFLVISVTRHLHGNLLSRVTKKATNKSNWTLAISVWQHLLENLVLCHTQECTLTQKDKKQSKFQCNRMFVKFVRNISARLINWKLTKGSILEWSHINVPNVTNVSARQELLCVINFLMQENGEFACNRCVKTFTEAFTLRSHQRMHSGEKPCICNVCEKSFTNSASLTNHKRMHTGETPFACKLCKKSFTQSIDLKDHQSVHGSRYLW